MSSQSNQNPVGVLGLFEDVDTLMSACRRMRDAGFTKWEAHSSFPVHGLDEAAGIKPTVLPWICLVAGLTGTGTAILMQWWMNAVDYPYIISGKPFFSLPANIPVAFEMTILFAAFAAFFGMLILNGFPKWSNPLFKMPEWQGITGDKFAIVVDAADPNFKADGAFLREIGATHVAPVPGDDSPNQFPVWFHIVGATATILALVPIILIMRARFVTTDAPPIHVVPDMDFQWKQKAQSSSSIFPDGRAMRLPVEGTVAVGDEVDPNLLSYSSGATTVTDPNTGQTYRTDFPLPLTAELLDLGEEKWGIYCAPCHGVAGHGDGNVHKNQMGKDGWVMPASMHDELRLSISNGQMYSAIVNGVNNGNMASYAALLKPEERWAVVAYIRALQRSQNATTQDLPEGVTPQEAK